MDFFSSPNRPRKTTKKTANKNLIYKKALNITNFISLLLFISKKSVTLHRVFHSIRFKVNKGWVRALTLFLCPTVKPKKNRTLQSRVSALSALHVTTSPTIKYKPTENGKKISCKRFSNLLRTIFRLAQNKKSFAAR